MLIRVEGYQNLYRDDSSGAIINNDSFSYNQYMKMKEDKKKQKDEIECLKNEIAEIKSLLKEFLNGSK